MRCKLGHALSVVLILFLGINVNCTQVDKGQPNILRWNIASGVSTLDPAYIRSQADGWVSAQLYSTLLKTDEHLQIAPSIAYQYSISPDATQYTFSIRNDVFYHLDPNLGSASGRKLCAKDIEINFLRIADPKTASRTAWVFKNRLKSVFAKDSFTLIIALKEPFIPFLNLLTLPGLGIVQPEAIAFYGSELRSKAIGTGPFCQKFYTPSQSLTLHKHSLYFEKDIKNRSLPYLDAVHLTFSQNKGNELFALKRGQLDLLTSLEGGTLDLILDRSGASKPEWIKEFDLVKIPYLNTEYLGFRLSNDSNAHPILKNAILRKALSYSIDREELLRSLKRSQGSIGNFGLLPPYLISQDAYLKSAGYPYNPTKADSLLKSAGYPTGKGLAPFVLHTSSQYADVAVFIQSSLAKRGIQISIELVTPAALGTLKADGKSDFFRGTWVADYADPENYLSLFYSPNKAPAGPNYFHYANASYDSLYKLLVGTPTSYPTQLAQWQRLNEMSMEEAPLIVLYYDQILRMNRKGLTGIPNNQANLIDVSRAYWKE